MTGMPESRSSSHSPFQPSWFDRLVGWFDGLPGPTWLAYGIAALLLIPLNHAPRWIEGSVPLGSIDPARIFEIPLFLFYLPISAYLNTVAKKSMEEFRPLLNISASQFQQLQNELTTLPLKIGWLTGALGILVGSSSVLSSPSTWGLSDSSLEFTVIISIVIASALMALVISFLARVVRMLRTVDRIQRIPEKISVFRTDPVYAFSALTSRAGISIVALIYYYFFLVYSVEIYGPNPPISFIDYFSFGTLLLTGFAAFIVPLNGMHSR